jgi:hypothetical protein
MYLVIMLSIILVSGALFPLTPWFPIPHSNGCTISAFLFKEVLCRWGAIEGIVTDNGTPYVTALEWLMQRYSICHICILAYNS